MHHFPGLRNRTTEHRKAGKARNTKENRRSKEFSMASKLREELHSSQRDKQEEKINFLQNAGTPEATRLLGFF